VTREPRTFTIDMGGCWGWTLQRGNPDSTEFIRCVDDNEFKRIMNAVAFCRRYVLRSPARLLVSSHQVWRNIVSKMSDHRETPHLSPELYDELESAFIGWLLIWRLVFDQLDHNVSTRFGRESRERLMLKSARSNAYDTRQGYRVVEAMRNLVQHRDMLPLNVSKTGRLDRQSGKAVRGVEFTFPVSWLLESSKCPAKVKAEFKDTPMRVLDMIDIADDAMAGFQEVFVTIIKINRLELLESINLLRQIFGQAHPGLPILLRMKRPDAGARIYDGTQVQMERIDDLLRVVREAPFGEPYRPSGDVDT
jgi:hypothetical protein